MDQVHPVVGVLQTIGIDKVVILILGWLFGLLTTPIVDGIRKRREARDVSSSVMPELYELQHRLTLTIFLIEQKYGLLTQESIAWYRLRMATYTGVDRSADYLAQLDLLNDPYQRGHLGFKQRKSVRSKRQPSVAGGHVCVLRHLSHLFISKIVQ